MIGLTGRWARTRRGAGIALSMIMTIATVAPMKVPAQDRLLAAVASWFWFPRDWGLQLEARGRQVGSGASMGEFSLGVARRFGSSGR